MSKKLFLVLLIAMMAISAIVPTTVGFAQAATVCTAGERVLFTNPNSVITMSSDSQRQKQIGTLDQAQSYFVQVKQPSSCENNSVFVTDGVKDFWVDSQYATLVNDTPDVTTEPYADAGYYTNDAVNIENGLLALNKNGYNVPLFVFKSAPHADSLYSLFGTENVIPSDTSIIGQIQVSGESWMYLTAITETIPARCAEAYTDRAATVCQTYATSLSFEGTSNRTKVSVWAVYSDVNIVKLVEGMVYNGKVNGFGHLWLTAADADPANAPLGFLVHASVPNGKTATIAIDQHEGTFALKDVSPIKPWDATTLPQMG